LSRYRVCYDDLLSARKAIQKVPKVLFLDMLYNLLAMDEIDAGKNCACRQVMLDGWIKYNLYAVPEAFNGNNPDPPFMHVETGVPASTAEI
jgi:hypothetical protein